MNKTGRLYEFGPFRLDTGERTLLREASPVPVTPKVFDLLVILLENPGRLLNKEDLLKSLWPETFVEEANLSVNVSTLRKALGESPSELRYIETVPKRGYRFIGAVREITPAVPTEDPVPANPAPVPSVRPSWRSVTRGATAAAILIGAGLTFYISTLTNRSGVADIHSLAVLPFKALQDKPEDDYLGLGMADALINKLTNVRQIAVRPTSAIQKYCVWPVDHVTAGKQLQVDALLEGRIQRVGSMIRVSVQLLRVRDQSPIWAATFDDSFTNIFALQDSISERVAAALSMRLTAGEKKAMSRRHTANPAAYDLYVQGQYLAAKRAMAYTQEAVDLFRRAVERDPEYALPYAGMAAGYITLAGAGRGMAMWEKARIAGRKAVTLDDSLAEAHLALGKVLMRADWDWDGAHREFDRALGIDSRYAAAHAANSTLLTALVQQNEAIHEMELACRYDPESAGNRSDLGWTLYCARKYDEAVEQSKKAILMDSASDVAHRQLEKEYLAKKLFTEAKIEYEKTQVSRTDQPGSGSIADLGLIEVAQGNWTRARAILDQLRRVAPEDFSNYEYEIAKLHVSLGENDAALEFLTRACDRHLARAIWMRVDPELDPLRADARFEALLKRVHLLR